MTDPIRFTDGAAYQQYMGVWSQLAGRAFLRWSQPRAAMRWLDVGCGNGAFTELLITDASPAGVVGIDPAPAQIAFARERESLRAAEFQHGDAMALPFDADTFDAAIMPLVIFFVPQPEVGVLEMVRVVRPGGLVAAYAWDMDGGGFPYAVLHDAMRALEIGVPTPPSISASDSTILRELWRGAGLESVSATEIAVERTYDSFDDYWRIVQGGASVGSTIAALDPARRTVLQHRLRESLPIDAGGRITYAARANAVTGLVPVGPQ